MRKKLLVVLGLMVLFVQGGERTLNLMPYPEKVVLHEGKFVLTDQIAAQIKGPESERVKLGWERFRERLAARTGIFYSLEPSSKPFVIVYHRRIKLAPVMDESYSLKINSQQVLLQAETDVGIIRGLETLLQLLEADDKGYFFPAVEIYDRPRFAWRGLLIDVCRHFISLEVIKHNIDAMAAVKLNVLHLHLSEDQGFRVESKKFPRLHRLASDGKYFTQEQLKEIVRYADLRGIRVVPEFDVPGHTTSWLVAYPALAALPGPYSLARTFGVKDPVMDPTKKLVYKFLDKFFAEMARIFPDPYFHIGGDEVNGKHWKASPSIQKFMRKHKIKDKHQLQAYFNRRLLKILKKHGKKMMGWDEILHPDLPREDVLIQSWRGRKFLYQAAQMGFKTILSNGYYIDLLQPAAYHYLNDPIPEGTDLPPQALGNILGGEATMWSELVNAETVDSRIWPRTAAIAERLWSPADRRDVRDMFRRLWIVSQQLEELGVGHIKNREAMMRRLAGYADTRPLKIFLQAVEPLKYYRRHHARTYTVFSPLSRAVDAAVVDPVWSVRFRYLVEDFLKERRKYQLEQLRALLLLWRDNHEKLRSLAEKSPVLKEVCPLSFRLSHLASLALEALSMLEEGRKPCASWFEKAERVLKASKEPVAELEIAIVPPVEKLVEKLRDLNVK